MSTSKQRRAPRGPPWPCIHELAVYGEGMHAYTVRICAEARNGWWIIERVGGRDGTERICVKGTNLQRVVSQLF